MSRRFQPSVVTANDLFTGHSVWLTEDDRWAPTITEAELIEDEAHAQIRLLEAQARPGEVVGPYLTPARAGRLGPEPVELRERHRVAPTV